MISLEIRRPLSGDQEDANLNGINLRSDGAAFILRVKNYLGAPKTTSDLLIDDAAKIDAELASIIIGLVKIEACRSSSTNAESGISSADADELTSRSCYIPSQQPCLYL